MAGKRVFISFDYDYDVELKNALVGQSRLPDSPFEITDYSIKDPSPGWKAEARRRIRACCVVAVLCGEHTDTADGVSVELQIAREEEIPYFLLEGRPDAVCQRPRAANFLDKVYTWTWPNLKLLISGSR